jgi:ATP-binding cassette, subfamily C (CFTR/MRP), member 1
MIVERSHLSDLAAVFWLCNSLLQVFSPQITKKLLAYLTTSYNYHRASEIERETMNPPRSIGYGIGLAIALFVMQQTASLFRQ